MGHYGAVCDIQDRNMPHCELEVMCFTVEVRGRLAYEELGLK